MANDYQPYDGYDGYGDGHGYHRRGVNSFAIIGIGFFFVLSFYASLVVATRLDQIVLPGNELVLGGFIEVVPGAEAPPPADTIPTIDQRINVLFLGLDRRIDEDENQPYRTDSVMVMTIDPFSKTAGAFSIPRDTVVEYLDADGNYVTHARINEAWEYGQYPDLLGVYAFSDYPGGGPGLAMDTIEHNFGIPIDHYMVMDWIDFMSIIDKLGGVDIDIPEYAYDPAYTICSYCGEVYPVEFLPSDPLVGPTHMDGGTALAYARIRKSDNDYKRIERQQLVLKAMAQKAASVESILSDPIGLYNEFKDAIETDVSDFRAAGLGALFREIQSNAVAEGREPIRTISMAPATYPCQSCNYAGLEWYPEMMEELKAQVFSDSRLSNESAVIEVLNTTTTPDVAATFGGFLRTKGIPATSIIEDEYANGEIYPTSVVIDVTGGHDHTIDQVQEWLSLPDSRVITATSPEAQQFAGFLQTPAHIIVILGEDIQIDPVNGGVTVTEAPAVIDPASLPAEAQ